MYTTPKENNPVPLEQQIESVTNPDTPLETKLATFNSLLAPDGDYIREIDIGRFSDLVSRTDPSTRLLLSTALHKNIDDIRKKEARNGKEYPYGTYPELQYYRIASYLLPHIHEYEADGLISKMPLEVTIYHGDGDSTSFTDYIENIITQPSEKMFRYKKGIISRVRDEVKSSLQNRNHYSTTSKFFRYAKYINLMYQQTTKCPEDQVIFTLEEIIRASQFPLDMPVLDPKVTMSVLMDIQNKYWASLRHRIRETDILNFVKKQIFGVNPSTGLALIDSEALTDSIIAKKILDQFGNQDEELRRRLQDYVEVSSKEPVF